MGAKSTAWGEPAGRNPRVRVPSHQHPERVPKQGTFYKYRVVL